VVIYLFIVSDKLCFRKLCSRWVPNMLMDEHKMKRQASVLTFLTRYSEQGDDFLSRIVTKQQSMEWRHTSSPIKKKFKQTISTCKIMCTVFWDRKGVLLVEFLPQGSTIATHLRNCVVRSRTGDVACLVGVL
jgi:hypothetical protein